MLFIFTWKELTLLTIYTYPIEATYICIYKYMYLGVDINTHDTQFGFS